MTTMQVPHWLRRRRHEPPPVDPSTGVIADPLQEAARVHRLMRSATEDLRRTAASLRRIDDEEGTARG